MSETPVQAGKDGGRRHGEAGIDLVVLREEVVGTQGSPELAPYTYGGVRVPEDKVLPLSRCGRRSQDGVQTVYILHGRADAETVVVVEQGDVQFVLGCRQDGFDHIQVAVVGIEVQALPDAVVDLEFASGITHVWRRR